MSTSTTAKDRMIEGKPACADLSRVASCADALLAQCRDFILASRGVFTTPCPSLMNSTIGQHLRHNLDHFSAAIGAFTDASPIDYDHRARGTPVESDPDEALRVVDSLRARLADRMDEPVADAPVTVRVMLTAGGEEAALRSTLSRELAFASHHAVHHHAMMAAIAHAHGVPVPPGFGKAPSTLNHESAPAR